MEMATPVPPQMAMAMATAPPLVMATAIPAQLPMETVMEPLLPMAMEMEGMLLLVGLMATVSLANILPVGMDMRELLQNPTEMETEMEKTTLSMETKSPGKLAPITQSWLKFQTPDFNALLNNTQATTPMWTLNAKYSTFAKMEAVKMGSCAPMALFSTSSTLCAIGGTTWIAAKPPTSMS
jgi:hypothetical protein